MSIFLALTSNSSSLYPLSSSKAASILLGICYGSTPFSKRIPGGPDGKESAHTAGNLGSIPGSERSLEKEMTIHYSIPAWRIQRTDESVRLHTVHEITKSQT